MKQMMEKDGAGCWYTSYEVMERAIAIYKVGSGYNGERKESP